MKAGTEVFKAANGENCILFDCSLKTKRMAIHKGTELNNINETWQQNEKQQNEGKLTDLSSAPAGVSQDLQQTISNEAAEYDNADKEERLLDGERATLRDENNE